MKGVIKNVGNIRIKLGRDLISIRGSIFGESGNKK